MDDTVASKTAGANIHERECHISLQSKEEPRHKLVEWAGEAGDE